ncbi:MAG: hypothetical protein C0602_03725 [Denitrovibrio sp.]|nr:MAG: hypothetical protein C0602_03725 [Denitrovibrio sp.]
MTLFQIIDFIGTVSFAASGALAGVRKQLDLYGICFLAIVTAIGGGTTRDVMLGHVPPFAFTEISYFLLSIATAIVVFTFQTQMTRTYTKLVWMDAVGLGLFNVTGLTIALSSGVGYFGSIVFGVITCTVGGMMRDVIIGETPFVLKQEIYATACIISGVVFCLMHYLGVNMQINMMASAVLLFAIRMVTYKFRVHMPSV